MFDRIKICAAVCLSALIYSTASLAQDQRPLTPEEQQDWLAIGLVFFGASPEGAVCTGTLVAPDLVLTAAHCVGDGNATAGLTFAAGWRQDQAVAVRMARAVVRAEVAKDADRTLANDLALIVLDREIAVTLIAPLSLLPADRLAETYSFIGYRRDMPGVIARTDDCALQGVEVAVLRVGCTAVSGNSGAPLLVWHAGLWQVAAVMVATAGPQSLAAIPREELRTRIAAP